MLMAIVLLAIVVGSVIFHLVSPWWSTELASNWKSMDDTLTITVVITGLFFVVISLFVAYTLLRFRHRPGRKAAYHPENPRLERWLIGVTTVGIVALLAPGLVVYADYVDPPEDALLLEVVGSQWQWRYRFVGESAKLGASDARFVTGANPLGIDPSDQAAQNNVVVIGNEVHLPLNRPVKVIARSHDVLHDFYVPPMRARMNIVPGQVSSFWFTPTKAGRYEAMCAQLCGTGHANMRGVVVVEPAEAFDAWLKTQPTFAATQAGAGRLPPVAAGGDPAELGRTLAQVKGCIACHSIDGAAGVGPTWKGLFGRTETLADGSTLEMDQAAIEREIIDPAARIIKGYPPIMPKPDLTPDEVAALAAYIKSL